MTYYRVWLQGGRIVILEGDTLEITEPQDCRPGELIVRKDKRVIGRFASARVEGYHVYAPPSPAFPRLARRRFARYFPPVLLGNMVRRMVWRFQNPAVDV